MTAEEKRKLVDIFIWLDYEFGISEHYENGMGDLVVSKLQSSHRIADNKVAEFLEMLGFNSYEELSESRRE